MEVFDYLLDSNLDIQIKNGDIEVGETTLQNQNLLLLCEPGEFKQYPTSGVGIRSYLLDDASPSDLKSAISKEFEADGMKISSLKITPEYQLTMKATYK